MTKYYLKDHVTDEMLEAVGFVKDEESSNENFTWFDRDCLKNADEELGDDFLVVATKHPYLRNERRLMFNYPNCRFDDDIENYIQDLIQLGYVEVRNE